VKTCTRDRTPADKAPWQSIINPATEVLATYDAPHPAVESSPGCGGVSRWREVSFDERAALFRRLARKLRDDRARLAGLITLEMGKPVTQAEAEIEKCTWNCDFYAEQAQRFLSPEPVPTSAQESYVAFAPLGVVLADAWNSHSGRCSASRRHR
jgi:succinate-semialdehyde dehydrogenase/glutarate-semialdehyde dehydrogenase